MSEQSVEIVDDRSCTILHLRFKASSGTSISCRLTDGTRPTPRGSWILIVDLDRPYLGLLQVGQDALLEVQRQIGGP